MIVVKPHFILKDYQHLEAIEARLMDGDNEIICLGMAHNETLSIFRARIERCIREANGE